MNLCIIITLNFNNTVHVITNIRLFNQQPIFNIKIHFSVGIIINPKSIIVSRQLAFDKFRIIYDAIMENYEYSNVTDDVGILLSWFANPKRDDEGKFISSWVEEIIARKANEQANGRVGREGKRIKLDYAMMLYVSRRWKTTTQKKEHK